MRPAPGRCHVPARRLQRLGESCAEAAEASNLLGVPWATHRKRHSYRLTDAVPVGQGPVPVSLRGIDSL
jgi:hypothetical protein